MSMVPCVGPITAFVLRLDDRQVRKGLARPLDGVFSGPLKPGTGNVGSRLGIGKDSTGPGVEVASFDRTCPDFRPEAGGLECRSKIIADEVAHLGAGPDAGRKFLVGIRFILDMDGIDSNVDIAVGLNKFNEVVRVSLAVFRLPDKRPVIVGLREFHPGRRAPGRGKEGKVPPRISLAASINGMRYFWSRSMEKSAMAKSPAVSLWLYQFSE